MYTLDMRTIISGHTISNILAALVLIWVWTHNRNQYKGLLIWVFDYVLQTAGQILLLMRGSIPDWLSIVVANGLIIAGPILFLVGLERFSGKPVAKITNLFIFSGFIAAYAYFAIALPSLYIRIIIFSIVACLITIQIIFHIMVSIPAEKRKIYRSMLIVSTGYLILYIIRAVYSAFNDPGNSFFDATLSDALFIISSQMLTIFFAFSMVITINAHLYFDLLTSARENESLLIRVNNMATTDTLTGVFNRTKMEQILKAEIDRTSRYLSTLSVILIDFDGFAEINDSYGHSEGDEVLKDTAGLLASKIRVTDSIGRWGGEEFLVICPETDNDGSRILGEKLRDAVAEYPYGQSGSHTISLGGAAYQLGDTMETLLKRARESLFLAKERGKNRMET